MKPLDIYKRHLQLARPTDRNMWKIFGMTAANLAFRGVRLSYEELAELENDYHAFVLEGTPLVEL